MRRVLAGLLAKDQSFGTGILLALLVWTLTRVVNEVVGPATIEYAVSYSPIQLDGGGEGAMVVADLTNLSQDSPVRGLAVSVNDLSGQTEFLPDEAQCTFPPPMWIDGASCKAYSNGLSLIAPTLDPGISVRLAAKYRGAIEEGKRPLVRIKASDGTAKLRMVTPGFQTWLARHEMWVLTGLLVLVGLALATSIAAGVRKVE